MLNPGNNSKPTIVSLPLYNCMTSSPGRTETSAGMFYEATISVLFSVEAFTTLGSLKPLIHTPLTNLPVYSILPRQYAETPRFTFFNELEGKRYY